MNTFGVVFWLTLYTSMTQIFILKIFNLYDFRILFGWNNCLVFSNYFLQIMRKPSMFFLLFNFFKLVKLVNFPKPHCHSYCSYGCMNSILIKGIVYPKIVWLWMINQCIVPIHLTCRLHVKFWSNRTPRN